MQHIEIKTEDGSARATLCTPTASHANGAGVLLYMDGIGYRPAMDDMAERYAAAGYTVLLPDLFYRAGHYEPFDANTAFSDPDSKAKILGNIRDTTQAMTRRDAHAFLRVLDDAGATGPIGVVGYCMGGSRALHTAAEFPDRIRAAASFHGGGLAGDSPESPHLVAADIKARVYVGSAGVDGSFPPEQSARLAESLRRGEVDHVIENYVGMQHGWTIPDHGAFNAQGAERHWKRVLNLFSEALAQ